ncbi:MAG: purine-nucleoside phosphorylase [Crocinitomicaceae bacterium]|nr:purine-nucleoside phosphorylase [Crocinitomicaceae bacterium]
MLKKITEAAEYISARVKMTPEIGIVLGTGLGGLVNEIEVETKIHYSKIPNFALSTVESHSGQLIFGKLGNKNVVAMQGRFHYYEGYSMEQITFPIRVMKFLGVEKLLLSNAAGGLNPDFGVGEIVIIKDHINLFPDNPLIGENLDQLGPRFVDLYETYSPEMRAKALEIAKANDIKVEEGVYAGLTGPALETEAEYKYLRIIGGDTVGMSTIPEVLVARHMDIPVFAISIVTDLGIPGKIKPIDIPEIIAVAEKQEPKMTVIMKELIASL